MSREITNKDTDRVLCAECRWELSNEEIRLGVYYCYSCLQWFETLETQEEDSE